MGNDTNDANDVHDNNTTMVENAMVEIKIPKWCFDRVVQTLDRFPDIGELILQGEEVAALPLRELSWEELEDLQTKNFVTQKALQVSNLYLGATKRRMYSKFQSTKEGDSAKYEGVKRLITHASSVLVKLYKAYGAGHKALEGFRYDGASGFQISLGELAGLTQQDLVRQPLGDNE